MAKSILLTGATGFIGSHLLEALIDYGYKVVILKRTTSDTWRISHLLDHVKSYDVDNMPIKKIFEEQKIDTVVHLATLYRKFGNDKEISDMIISNVVFPSEILEIGIRHGIKSFINTGTFFECDCSSLPVDEHAPSKAFNFYAKTKISFESLLKTYSEQLNIITLRLFSPYGPKDNDKLIPQLIKKALREEQIILSEGFQKLDFTYKEDIVQAFLKAIKKVAEQKVGYKTYNIGSGISLSVREIVSIIEEQLGSQINKIWGPPSKMNIPIAFADIRQAKTDLNWTPEYSIHQGINITVKYYQHEGLN